ncbi:MAG: TasA family protein [bacterium]|nr:TasA family protein [bacterium]
MKKIILSAGMIAVVGALAIGGTIAFYNDTETSTGNIFTAGSIDLKVDHTRASYNGEECQTCHLEIVSNSTTQVGTSPAVELSFVHAAWTADLDGGHVAGVNDGTTDGSKWIWITDGPTLPTTNQDYTFDRSFVWNGTASDATLYIATDNLYTSIVLNGNPIGSTADDNNFQLATEDVFNNLESSLVQGTNVLQVTVRNIGLSGGTPTTNPAGLLFKLEIDGTCQGDTGSGVHEYENTPDNPTCKLWGPKDLDDSDYYFDFDDVKPGDYGTNLISLHVDDNDAYACLIPHDLNDQDNNVVDPELDLSDDGPEGELSGELQFFLWEDNGDGVYQLSEDILAGPGTTINQIQTEMTALELTGGGATEYVGLAWCAGDQTLDGATVECDGAGMGDIAQTDSLLASLTAYAEQIRNNPDFTCEGVGSLDTPPAP